MTPSELKKRTGRFSDEIIQFCGPLLDNLRARDIARQLLRSGTAVDANYGSAQRARSPDEFTSRIGIVFDEIAESAEWLAKLAKHALVPPSATLSFLLQEADELTRIFAKSYATAKANQAKRKGRKSRPHRNSSNDSDNPITR